MEDAESRVEEPGGSTLIDEKLSTLAARPGVYLLKDRQGKVIYVARPRTCRAEYAATSRRR